MSERKQTNNNLNRRYLMKKENIRIKEFRQLRKEIRGSKEYLIVGIDVAKEKHNAFFGTATGKTLFKRLVFENSREGFERLVRQTEAIKVENNLKKVVFGMEATSNYHKPLGEYLIKRGDNVVLVSGVAVKRNRELLDGRWDKHDLKDSANVADLVSQGKCQYYEYPCMEVRDLRRLLSLKRYLKKQEQRLTVRIRNTLLAQYFPEMDRYYGSFESENLAIVRHLLFPSTIAGMQYSEFFKTVATRNKGLRQHKHLYNIWQQAGHSIGCEAGEAATCEAAVLVEQLQQMREEIGYLEEEIKNVCFIFSAYEYLLSIPGFGHDVSSKVLAYLGDPFRFDNRKQVLRMSGYDLCANRSGKRSRLAIPVISKRGKADLRYALYQAALIASIRNRHFIEYYTEKIRGREREKGIKTKMRVKLAAKMLVIAWSLMKKKEPFNPDYLKR
jgi:transposase